MVLGDKRCVADTSALSGLFVLAVLHIFVQVIATQAHVRPDTLSVVVC